MPSGKSDPPIVLGVRESRAQGEAAGRSPPASGAHGPHTEAEDPCQHNWSGSQRRREQIARVFERDFWGARCGKLARRVLRGEGGTRARILKAALYPSVGH